MGKRYYAGISVNILILIKTELKGRKKDRQFALLSFVITAIAFILLPFASKISFNDNVDKVTNIGILNETQTVTDNLIEGDIIYKNQEAYYYTTPVTGVYRFVFDVSDVNCPF